MRCRCGSVHSGQQRSRPCDRFTPRYHVASRCGSAHSPVPRPRRYGLLLIEQLAEVSVASGRLAGLVALGGRLLIRRQALAVGVAERDDLDVVHLHQAEEVVLAVPAGTDQGDPALGVGGSGTHQGECGRGGAEEVTAIEGTVWHQRSPAEKH